WSQGIYNIINRHKEETDDYYNIVFDMVIPEDKHIVDKILNITNKEISQCEETFRIMDGEGALKFIEVNIYSYFDEGGIFIRQGLVKVIKKQQNELSKPVDFLLDGFKSSTKLALLIEPLSEKQYNFSKGFYYLIEKDYDEYDHSREILDDIVEKDVVDQLQKLADGEITTIDETLTYKVDGNPQNEKIVDLYIERFKYNNNVHSLGFLTDITEEMQKQEELFESNEQQLLLIKELHHRVKNNLQILNSFLNLEKRAYKDFPDLIIEHMQTRLISLALLHEKTYNSPDFKNINLKEYLLDHDMEAKKIVDSPIEIEFETHVNEDINLSIEVITPLLLIIDELTMILIRNALPDKTGQNKKITKKVTKLDNDTAILTIEESGIEINDSDNIENNFGYEIIKSLTKQLNGSITSVKNENVITYKLVFPIEIEHTIN
ncbi:MAG: sensor histidine kinase, partial [Methanobrevibacter sp.]|nr:sensor histidine kinase [Methanobrevibacter sp.]